MNTLGLFVTLRVCVLISCVLFLSYENSMLVTYNVQCPAGRRAFYNAIHLDLQEADCFDRYAYINTFYLLLMCMYALYFEEL